MKVAVVTGGNKGIGFAIVKGLCEQFDGKVYLTARNGIKGNAAVCKLRKMGYTPVFHQLDVTDKESVQQFRDYILKHEGGVDLLFNNAGISLEKCVDIYLKQAEDTLNVNYYGAVNASQILAPILRYGAKIINTSSFYGHLSQIPSWELKAKFGAPSLTVDGLNKLMEQYIADIKENKHIENGWGDSPYTVSKVAVSALTVVLQRFFNNDPEKRQISVNCFHPGYTKTDLTSNNGIYTPEEGARPALWIALEAEGLRGQFVWNNLTVIDWPKYLLFDELTYELLIRGVNISRPHDEKRKILCRALDKERTSGVSLINLDKYDVSLETQIKEINTLNSIETLIKEFEGSSNDSLYKRLRSRITHVTSRILRLITPDDQSDVKNELYANALLFDAELEESRSQSEPINTSTTFSAATPVINVQPPIVNCNSRYTNVSDLNITFNGDPSKLPSFLEHVTDLSKSRKISDDELFNSAVELFVDDAFIWFRSVKNTVSDWTSLVSLLKSEFLPTDYEDQIWEQRSLIA
ncbi:hypothetical protein RN001_002109 [Aquatica leii]|uniref:Uncharacterized protein n=1 Tax=Aquatica leii TaxID=1421715 RepID=A0AAN7SR45_9COLE|nr:hypothetical protein RN001_002109 [Aquatica leii]